MQKSSYTQKKVEDCRKVLTIDWCILDACECGTGRLWWQKHLNFSNLIYKGLNARLLLCVRVRHVHTLVHTHCLIYSVFFQSNFAQTQFLIYLCKWFKHCFYIFLCFKSVFLLSKATTQLVITRKMWYEDKIFSSRKQRLCMYLPVSCDMTTW